MCVRRSQIRSVMCYLEIRVDIFTIFRVGFTKYIGHVLLIWNIFIKNLAFSTSTTVNITGTRFSITRSSARSYIHAVDNNGRALPQTSKLSRRIIVILVPCAISFLDRWRDIQQRNQRATTRHNTAWSPYSRRTDKIIKKILDKSMK